MALWLGIKFTKLQLCHREKATQILNFYPRFSGSGFPAPAGFRVGNTINQLLSRIAVLNGFTKPFHPMGEFGKCRTLINFVFGFNQLQPLNPEP